MAADIIAAMRKKLLVAFAGLVVLGLAAFLSLPRIVDSRMNTVEVAGPYTVSPAAQALHNRLFVADLHSDSLLWSRDLLSEHSHGHVDLPRIKQGHVALQVFATVTKSPRRLNFDSNGADSDTITALVMAQLWPVRTWFSLLERSLYQSEKLHQAAAESGGALRIVRTRAELEAFLKAEPVSAAAGRGHTAAVLDTEGLHPLEGKLANVGRMFDAGFRIAGLTHFFDNELGGSAHGLKKGGLTPFGREVVRELEDRKMLVDLAHASPAVIDDVLAMARRPVVVSHTGVRYTCPGPRNLSDAQIRRIAANGGVIGIGYFKGGICQMTPASIVAAMRHVVQLVGVKHVALGSDFDGATHAVFDTSGVALITQGLLDAKLSEEDIAAILGGNVRRLLLESLP